MNFKSSGRKLLIIAALLLPTAAWAAHPLITDDAGTQGKGNFQLEVNGQYDTDRETTGGVETKSAGGQVAATLSYGITENIDLVLSQPYVWGKVTENGVNVYDEKGISDTVFEVKYRFFEKNGFSIAVKPGISFATGDGEKGLGTGRTGYHIFLIGSKDAAPWGLHANIWYIRNENNACENVDIWQASLAVTYEIVRDLKLVGNIGISKNREKTADNDPAFVLAGVIYSITNNFDIDFGVKTQLSSSETDLSFMAGAAFRF